MNLGKDSNLYIAHRCYHIMVLKMLGQYEENREIMNLGSLLLINLKNKTNDNP